MSDSHATAPTPRAAPAQAVAPNSATPPAPPRRYSMSLLTDFLDGGLEPSYAAAAARRPTPGIPRRRPHSSVATVSVALAMGLLFAMAWTNVRSTSSVVTRARTELIDRVTAQQEHGDAQAAQVALLQAQLDAAQAAALGQSGQGGLLAEVTRLQLAAGTLAVTGPGGVITLDDAAPADADAGAQPRGGSGFGKNRVSAADLQIVVNGLWAAGAEAISVNGQRLTARSAIRFAGEAILVDFRALARPYVITAIGDPSSVTSGFGNSPAGSYLKALDDNFGITVRMATSTSLTCPPGSTAELRYAQPRPSGIPSSQPTPAPATTTSSTPTSTPTKTRTTRPGPTTSKATPR